MESIGPSTDTPETSGDTGTGTGTDVPLTPATRNAPGQVSIAPDADAPPTFPPEEEEEEGEGEQEVDVTNVHFKYAKLRSSFGRQTQFLEDRARVHCGLRANRERYHPLFQQKSILDKECDTMVGLHDLVTNTARVDYRSVSLRHAEGGWPKDINPRDKEQVEKYRKKLQKEDSFIDALPILCKESEVLVKHNNSLSLCESLNKNIYQSKRDSKPSANVVTVYNPPSYYKRPVSRITFSPGNTGRMGTAYCPYEFDPIFRNHACEAYIWEVENATRPEGMVRASSQIVDLRFHPTDWFIVCGALFSGQVCTWDNRVGPNPQAISDFDQSHEDVCTSTLWRMAEDENELFSCGLDGNVIWWDSRNLSERKSVIVVESENGPAPIRVMEYDPEISNKFLVGTQFGEVAHYEDGALKCLYKAHKGPVRSVKRNPTFKENFMSCGGYILRIFAEECLDSGIMWTAPSDTLYSCAEWIPTRPSCMVASRVDGNLEIWDLLIQGSASIYNGRITDDALSIVCPTPDGNLIAAGTVRGDIRVIELGESMGRFSEEDAKELKACFSREMRREQGLAERLAAFKKKEDEEAKETTVEPPDPYKNQDILTDKNFFDMLAKEKESQGVDAFADKKAAAEAHNKMLIEGRMDEMKKTVEKAHKHSASELGATEAMGVNEETIRKANALLEDMGAIPETEEEEEEGDEGEEGETSAVADEEEDAAESAAPESFGDEEEE